VDCSLYGSKPGGHHLTNLAFHLANVVLLLFVLERMIGSLWRSALVAALFALHPLHVESVAWVSERKDVLSTFFWLLTMGAYLKYVRGPRRIGVYLLTLGFFVLGLLSKPMVVTLPFVLLLLDYWPLKRTGEPLKRLVLEKLPFVALAAMDCAATVWAQKGASSVVSTVALPLADRVANALVSYVLYLWKTLWPVDLAIPYPYSHEWTFAQAAGAALLLLAITTLALGKIRQMPQLTIGWFWYLGTLVPVIGLVQVGSQFMADRYTYVPLIGIFIMLAWSIPEKWAVLPRPGFVSATAGVAVLAGLWMLTNVQVLHWRNSITLFSHTIAVTGDNLLAQYNLAEALARRGDEDLAIENYLKAIAIKPNRVEAQYDSRLQAHYNLGAIYWKRRDFAHAESQFRACIQMEPKLANAHNNLAMALKAQGRLVDAAIEYEIVAGLQPYSVAALQILDVALAEAGKFPEAIAAAEKTLQLASVQGQKALADAAQKRLESYRAGKPYREQ
jgi:tetratricopeptide (TPR) repeat protein